MNNWGVTFDGLVISVDSNGIGLRLRSDSRVRQIQYTQKRCGGKHGNITGYGNRAWHPGQYCRGHGQAAGEAEAIMQALTQAEIANCPLIFKITGKYFTPELNYPD